MRRRFTTQLIAMIGMAVLSAAAGAAVINSTWTGGASTFNWGDAGNWDSGNAPDNNGDTYNVVFSTAPGGQLDLGADRAIDTLDIQATTLLGDSANPGTHTLTIAGGVLADISSSTELNCNLGFDNDLSFNKTAGGRLLLRGNLLSNNKFTKTGSAELRITSDSTSTFTGDVDIQGGLVFISSNGGVGNSSSQTVTIHSGATLSQNFAGGTLGYGAIIMNGGTLALRGCNVTSNVSGTGTISSSAGAGVLLSGDNSGFVGKLTFTGGGLSINGNLGTSDITYSASGGTFSGSGTILFNIVDGDYDTIRISNGATFSIGSMNLALDISGELGLETVIANYSGASLAGGQFASVIGLPWYAELVYGGTDLHPDSIVMLIPEPSSLALLALAGLGLLRRRRR